MNLSPETEMTDPRSSRTWGFIAALSGPAFGIALAYTIVTTYLPTIIARLSGPGVTGIVIAGEGLLALTVPVLVGTWSDATFTRLGRRMPFVLAGAAVSVLGLLLLPLASSALWGIGIGLTIFFFGYFVCYSPYYALFPDVVPAHEHGRSQGAQGGFRSLGMLTSLGVGGLLMDWWEPLPFLLGAIAVVSTTMVLYRRVRAEFGRPSGSAEPHRRGFATQWHLLRQQPDLRRWAIANCLWETALAALRVFVVLYFTHGLGLSLTAVSGILALVGAAAIVAAPVSGSLADRYGHRPIMLSALWIFTVGLLPALLTTNTAFIVLIFPVAFAAVVLFTLPYSVLMGLLPEKQEHGVGAGLFGFSRGLGVLIGPLLAGTMVEVSQSWNFLAFGKTQGYAAVFLVTAIVLLASIPVFTRINTRAVDDRVRP